MMKPSMLTTSRRASHALLVALTLGCGFQAMPATAGEGGGSAGFGVPGVAEREIARRLEAAQQAATLAAEGDRLMAEGDYAGAIAKYKDALKILPPAPATEVQRESTVKRFCAAANAEAQKLANEGDYQKARELLEEILLPDMDPENRTAARLLRHLDDPDRYQPARTPAYTADVEEVTRLLHFGESHYLLGEYDKAEEQFFKVLTIDRYNTAAREFLEQIERVRIDYYGAAYNHTRSRMLRMVDQLWETKPPMVNLPAGVGGTAQQAGKDPRVTNLEALQTIIIPKVDFEETTLNDAVIFLRNASRQYDPRPGKPGVNILIRSSNTVEGQSNAGEKIIPELRLTNLPLGEVLRYLSEITGMRVRVEQFSIVLVSGASGDVELYSRSFQVSPDFIPQDAANAGGGGGGEIDPFGGGGAAAGGRPALPTRMRARDHLISLGVPFPEGATADFNTTNSVLTVRNTAEAMEMIEGLVEADAKRQPKQVHIETKFVEVQQRNGKELGFDWLLGPAVISDSNGVAVAGGSAGTGITPASANYPFNNPAIGTADPIPVGSNPVTAGNRTGDFAITRNAIDSILNTSIGQVGADTVAPGILSIAGLLTEPQFQVVIRALDQKKGTDLLSAPSVTTKPGLPARIEIIREFIYPTEYDPPELPNSVGNDQVGGGGGVIPGPGLTPATVTTFPVTPATPAAFDTKNVGVTLEVDPVVGPNGFTIDLTLTPEVVEFEGFINYGNPITSGAIDGLGRPTQVVITENRIEMPIFSTRRVKTQVTVWDGQTVAIGGLIREDVQNVEDKVPLLGDTPIIGRLFKTKAEERFKRNLMVFVTARLIDPSGKPVNSIAGETFGGAGMFTTPATNEVPATTGATPLDNPILTGTDGLPTL
ncbi:MAG: Amuc_1098 family type IV pilus outer membrane protein [Verrucomicrobiales bacterium]